MGARARRIGEERVVHRARVSHERRLNLVQQARPNPSYPQRQVPSVDLASVPSPRNEQWFQVQLVDASDDSHETSSHMRFFLHSTEATAGAD